MIIDLTTAARPGLYVVEFPERVRTVATLPPCVKIGRSINVLGRVGQHGRDGAVRAWLSEQTSVLGSIVAERYALRAAYERDGRDFTWPTSEHFVDLSFEEAIEIASDAVVLHGATTPEDTDVRTFLEFP